MFFARKNRTSHTAITNLESFQNRFETGPVKMFHEHEIPSWIIKVSKIIAPFTNSNREYWQSHLMTEHTNSVISAWQKGYNTALKQVDQKPTIAAGLESLPKP